MFADSYPYWDTNGRRPLTPYRVVIYPSASVLVPVATSVARLRPFESEEDLERARIAARRPRLGIGARLDLRLSRVTEPRSCALLGHLPGPSHGAGCRALTQGCSRMRGGRRRHTTRKPR